MIYGYARVSTATQGRDGNSLEDQVAALEKYGCQEIIKEAFTGKTMERPKFLRLLEVLQEGDTLVVCKLDRFARTAIEGVQTVRELFDRGIRVHILNMGLIENTLTGNLILTVMLAFAEYERGMIVERTQTGKAVARQDPNFKDGRPKKFTPEQVDLALSLLAQGKTYRQIICIGRKLVRNIGCKSFGLSLFSNIHINSSLYFFKILCAMIAKRADKVFG